MNAHRISNNLSPLHKPKARQRRCVVKSIENTKELHDFLDHVGRCPMEFQLSVEYYRKMMDESRQTADLIDKISGHPTPPSGGMTRVNSDAMSMSRVNSVASANASMRSNSNSTVRFNIDASTKYSRLVSAASTISQGDVTSQMQSSFLSGESETTGGASADAVFKDVSSSPTGCSLWLLPKGERAIVSI